MRMCVRSLAAVAITFSVCACDRSSKSKPVASNRPPAAAPATAPAKWVRIMPDKYAIPWVAVIETPEGNELRVKMKNTLSTMQLVKVPGGTVEMAAVVDGKLDPSKKQTVQIKPFWIGKTELPWEFYDGWRLEQDLSPAEQSRRADEESGEPAATHSRPSKPYSNPDYGFGHEGYATISIHPHSAAVFCRWMSKLTGKKYRLPTEAEWEYACRAGAAVPVTKADMEKVAWFESNSVNNDTSEFVAQPIGRKAANAFGLHDMLGNVGEWTLGIDGKYALKGGWFEQSYDKLTPASRAVLDPNIMQARDPQDPKSVWWLSDGSYAGFRVVREED